MLLIIFQNERHFCSFYLPKLLVVGLMWITAVTLASWEAFNELRDPTYNYKMDAGNYLVREFIACEFPLKGKDV